MLMVRLDTSYVDYKWLSLLHNPDLYFALQDLYFVCHFSKLSFNLKAGGLHTL